MEYSFSPLVRTLGYLGDWAFMRLPLCRGERVNSGDASLKGETAPGLGSYFNADIKINGGDCRSSSLCEARGVCEIQEANFPSLFKRSSTLLQFVSCLLYYLNLRQGENE